MRTRGQVWVFSLLGAVALMAPACDGDDSDSNNDRGGASGAAGHGSAGDANVAGQINAAGETNAAGHTHTAGSGFGGDAGSGSGGAGAGGGGAGGAPDCGKVDLASGVVTCGEVKYRARVGTGCFYSPGDKEPAGGAGGGGATTSGGAAGADSGCDPAKCTAKPRGFCEAESPGASGAGPVTCHYGCLTDSECGASEICVCGGDPTYGGRCVQAFCKTDADCTNGNRCGSSTACDQFSCNDDPACAVN